MVKSKWKELKNRIHPRSKIPTEKEIRSNDSGEVEVFFNVQRMSTFRTLETNQGLFGDTLGKRIDETPKGFTSLSIGFRAELTKHLQLEGGLIYMKTGEQYAFDGGDTTFNYINTFRYIGLPLGLNYVAGDEIQFITGVGIIPGLLQSIQSEQEWVTTTNTPGDTTVIDRSGAIGYSPYVLNAYFQIGGQLKLSDQWSFSILPIFRLQLTSSFLQQRSVYP